MGIKGGSMMVDDRFVAGLDSRGSNGEMITNWFRFGICFPFWRAHFDGRGLLFTLAFCLVVSSHCSPRPMGEGYFSFNVF